MRDAASGSGACRWAVFFVYLLSVLAAVQVGRVAPAAGTLIGDLSIDLETLGWVVSVITLASALFGAFAGLFVVSYGLKRSLVHGSLALALAVFAAAAAPGLVLLLVFRALEGFAYLAVVVAAPTAIAAVSEPKERSTLLALWGTFFIVGISLASVLGGWLTELVGWRGWFGLCGASAALAALAAQSRLPAEAAADRGPVKVISVARGLPAPFWLLAGAFLSITLLSVSVLSTLPSFLADTYGFSQARAGLLTGIIALASLAGNVCYGLLSRWMRERSFVVLTNALLIVLAYPAYALGPQRLLLSMSCCALALFLTGVLFAQAFASVPKFAVTHSRIGVANGVLTQLGGIGALAGPPLVGWVVSSSGWQTVALVIAVAAMVQLLLLLGAHRT